MKNKFPIMIIDDEAAICDSLKTFFMFEEYEVDSCTDPVKALEMARNASFQIFLIDLSMPNMNGLELIKEIKNIEPLSQIIIMTGFVTRERILACVREGAAGCVLKPFKDLIEIKGMVDEVAVRLSKWYGLLENIPK